MSTNHRPDLGRFLDDLYARPVGMMNGRTTWQLMRPFAYYSSTIELLISVPEGFITDFASVPRLPLIWLLMSDTGQAAAVIHDHLWNDQRFPPSIANQVFHEALLVSGVSRWRAGLMHLAVVVASKFKKDQRHA
jgi:hypothetical protein